MKKVVLKESELWCQFEYHLKFEKFRGAVEFVTEEGEFVASFKPASRASKGIPVSEISAKFTQRFYKTEGLEIPTTLAEMRKILLQRVKNLHK